MTRTPKALIFLGDAWVDPEHVVAVDANFADDDPDWANVRVITTTGHIMYGLRSPERVVAAIRHPELEVEADEPGEQFPDQQARARRRHRRREAGRGSGRTDGEGLHIQQADEGHRG